MENLLTCLINDCRAMGNNNNMNCKQIQDLAKTALDLLESQTGLMQTPPYELREKCFAVLQAALTSNSGHLLRLGLAGCHKLLRDNHIVAMTCDPPDDCCWLSSQLLKTLKSRSWAKVSEDVQVEICKVLLNFSCLDRKYYSINARILVDLVSFCIDLTLDQSGGSSKYRRLQMASRNAAIKNVQSFVTHHSNPKGICEIVPIIQFFCDRLQELLPEPQRFFVEEFCLECILHLFQGMNHGAGSVGRLHNVVWRKLCPILTELIGIPETQAVNAEHRLKQFKLISGIGCELINLFGPVCALRAPIESLFHRILVVSNRTQRCEAFKSLKGVFQNPRHVLSLAGPFLVESLDILASLPTDLGLVRIIFDTMEESMQQEDLSSLTHSVILDLVNSLLRSLSSLTGTPSSEHLSAEYEEKMNNLYTDICSADYIGVLSLPSKLRMPKTYEQLLEDRRLVLMRLEEPKTDPRFQTRRTETEDPEDLHSTTSGVTEGPEPFGSFSDEEEDMELMERMKLFPYNPDLVVRGDHADFERAAAKKFLQELTNFLRDLPSMRSPLEVDIALQRFASDYCSSQINLMYNADGIYLAAYSALLFNYELIQKGFYGEASGTVPQSEEEFVNGVLNCGMLIYLTPDFLSEVYQGILISNLLQEAGLHPQSKVTTASNALINLLTDVRCLKSTDSAACFLSDCRKLHFASAPNIPHNDAKRAAGRKFSRRLLTCIWDSLLSIISFGISSQDNGNVSAALESLESAAKLANSVLMQERCGTIFSLLAAVACGNPPLARITQKKTRRMSVIGKKAGINLDINQVMSLDIILSKGLELASFNQEAWSHVLRCCLHVTDMERQLYKSRASESSKMAAIKIYTSKLSSKLTKSRSTSEDLNFSATAFGGLDDDMVDSYSFLTAASRLPANENEEEIIKEILSGSNRKFNLLDAGVAARVVASLSDRVATLLEDAASKLNLQSLLLLLNELCRTCRILLNKTNDENSTSQCIWVLHRIGEVMTRSVKTGRPLFHALHCWAVIGPTLLHAASSNDGTIAKTAVEILHTVISQVFQDQPEPPHFHFNEALLKPMENLLCFQMCDSDLQDQVTSCLCELVECWSPEIKSGWRALFACLRRYPQTDNTDEADTVTVERVKDTLSAFIQHGSSQSLIFANAAQDAILCLLHLAKTTGIPDLSLLGLQYLDQCSDVLIELMQSTEVPVFHSALRLNFCVSEPSYEVPEVDVRLIEEELWEKSAKCLYQNADGINADILDSCQGLLKVFYLLIEGLASSISLESCHQRNTCQVVMATVERIIIAEREDFADLCIRTAIVPAMLSWLEQIQGSSYANFKLACGLLCDISTKMKNLGQFPSTFSRLFYLFVHCASHSDEVVVRIGNSCLRHLAFFCIGNYESAGTEVWRHLTAALSATLIHNIDTLQRLLTNDVGIDTPDPSAAAILSLQLCLNTAGAVVLQLNEILPKARSVLGNLLLVDVCESQLQLDDTAQTNLAMICRVCGEFSIDAEFALATLPDARNLARDLVLRSKLRGLTLLSCGLYLISCINIVCRSEGTERMLKEWLEFLAQFYSESCDNKNDNTKETSRADLLQAELSKQLLLHVLQLLESDVRSTAARKQITRFLKSLTVENDESLSSRISSLQENYTSSLNE